MLDRTKSVSELVLDHPGAAGVLQGYRIDFCCRGSLSLAAACSAKGLDVDEVVAKLEKAVDPEMNGGARAPREMSTTELIGHIVSRHHAYLRRALPTIEALAAKVASVHGDHDPRLYELRDRVERLREALEPHLDAEEHILFPILTERVFEPDRRARELAEMREEHLRVGEILTEMRSLAADYEPPEWACTSYRALMGELAALETDTFRHVHLENHVLAPRFD